MQWAPNHQISTSINNNNIGTQTVIGWFSFQAGFNIGLNQAAAAHAGTWV
jgi:hypothetical protein